MRYIAIIGSGQAGLLAAHGLINAGYRITLYSDRTANQWLNESRPTGTAARFDISLSYERELGLNHWEKDAPVISYLLMRSTTERFADGTLYAFCSTTRMYC
jgi:2-polyprenyl-6-methoxyphenol hydroxylase-like FAD-dependent oxidoreductase